MDNKWPITTHDTGLGANHRTPEWLDVHVNPKEEIMSFQISFSTEQLKKANHQMRVINYFFNRKDELKDRAIMNLIKIKRTLELNNDLASGTITEEEFEVELNQHPDKYVIKILNDVSNNVDCHIIYETIRNAGLQTEISMDEVAEIFSLDQKCFINVMNQGGGLLFTK
jgi:hypothetical protein